MRNHAAVYRRLRRLTPLLYKEEKISPPFHFFLLASCVHALCLRSCWVQPVNRAREPVAAAAVDQASLTSIPRLGFYYCSPLLLLPTFGSVYNCILRSSAADFNCCDPLLLLCE